MNTANLSNNIENLENILQNPQIQENFIKKDFLKKFENIQILSNMKPLNFIIFDNRKNLLIKNVFVLKELLKEKINIVSYSLSNKCDFNDNLRKFIENLFQNFDQNITIFTNNMLILNLENLEKNKKNLNKIIDFIKNQNSLKQIIKSFKKTYIEKHQIQNIEVFLKKNLKIVNN